MPIIDYDRAAVLAEERFFSDGTVSVVNKKYVRCFLDAYDVSSARKAIFFRHVVFLLRAVSDVKGVMGDRVVINKVFRRLRDEKGDSYYGTIVNVSKCFVRWLNDGELPRGFRDLKGVSQKRQLRKLGADDMVSWEDGRKIADQFVSIQFKAIVLTQLDGGFRPSEFVDLRFGDVKVKGEFIIVRVRGGKTGGRDVILYRCVPVLQRWLQSHPSKKASDPLWVVESVKKSHKRVVGGGLRGYNYASVLKRLDFAARKAGVGKGMDFYNLRHSACTLAKKENMNPELAAEKFGHSVDYFVGTYGRLSVDDKIDRHKLHNGLDACKGVVVEHTIVCERCDSVNEAGRRLCVKCGCPLTIDAALEFDSGREVELKELREQVNGMQKELALVMKSFRKRVVV